MKEIGINPLIHQISRQILNDGQIYDTMLLCLWRFCKILARSHLGTTGRLTGFLPYTRK